MNKDDKLIVIIGTPIVFVSMFFFHKHLYNIFEYICRHYFSLFVAVIGMIAIITMAVSVFMGCKEVKKCLT